MMNKMINIITEVFAQWDVMELISIGMPRDEYKSEARIVALYMEDKDNNVDVDSLGMCIKYVFEDYFLDIFDIEECKQVAECILMNLED